MENDIQWRDISSYRQGQKAEDRVPNVWELNIRGQRIVIVNPTRFEGDPWRYVVYGPISISETSLYATDLEAAKVEVVSSMKNKINILVALAEEVA